MPIYLLTLLFTCGHGCGSPESVTLRTFYDSYDECTEAGRAWMLPAANPTFAIRGFVCEER